MCLAIPVRVTELLPDQMAKVSLDGVSKTVSVALLDELSVGDYVILHVGFALSKIDPDEAERTLRMIRDIAGSAS
ncbi:HypC/HybG/HupF family hydrogenase formation chaperone [Methylocystis parvus]|uniref:Hydrogenase maturation factor HypC n=1 Tax=Methylocystis parvus TaxID=134 RepID=A0A6B8M3Z3_9HYPH|nr:HypC/HybG/HupF family hydrogenase formation chaperone [Methylocystis parvus]QGM96812.1 HypC/HybG/HupF family hydrogenase formation chaperone [Methylocystis parvus]WBJ99310.1 HypC/HybG/HupF family hydrogenase formation chaperone [Methylocystis parvus OBBP]